MSPTKESNEDTMLQTSCSDYCPRLSKGNIRYDKLGKIPTSREVSKGSTVSRLHPVHRIIKRTKGEDLRECCFTQYKMNFSGGI
jgi:hypothetical protein